MFREFSQKKIMELWDLEPKNTILVVFMSQDFKNIVKRVHSTNNQVYAKIVWINESF
jgi:hypothetical protein